MKDFGPSFFSLTAAELMSREPVVLSQQMSLRAAAHLLAERHISGAPVVAPDGCCIGVLSATDVLRWAKTAPAPGRPPGGVWPSLCCDWQLLDLGSLPTDSVATYMSTRLVTVPPEATVVEIARALTAAHVHRVIVLDEQGKPLGLLSGSDLLGALASIADTPASPATTGGRPFLEGDHP